MSLQAISEYLASEEDRRLTSNNSPMFLVKAKWCFVKRQLQNIAKNLIKMIVRRWLAYVKFFGRRKYVLLLPPLIVFLLVMWPTLWWSMTTSSQGLRPYEPPSTEPPPQYNISRSLQHYLQSVQILIEPSRSSCEFQDKVLVIVLVATTSPSWELREAVRETWGIFQPTFFLMGRYGDRTKQMVSNRREAEMFNDIIVYDFLDEPSNETLKTALMMHWTLTRCPQALFMFKTKEDVMVNPWILNKVLWENRNAHLIGYSLHDKHKLTYESKKRYIQKMLREDGSKSLEYLSGTGYVIRGDYLEAILAKAYQVPMTALEDVYFTHSVARRALGLSLTHDRRLSPYKPWLPLYCVYWNQASIHSLAPKEMMNAWYHIEDLVVSYQNLKGVCQLFNRWFYLFSDLVLY